MQALGAGRLEDLAILGVAARAELLAIDFYDRAARAPGFTAAQERYLRDVADHERAHYATLAAALGDDVPAGLRFAYPDGTFDSPASAARTGAALEATFLGAYLGAVAELVDPGLRAVAARIAAAEAQHLSALDALLDPVPAQAPSLPSVLTVREAADALAPFLA